MAAEKINKIKKLVNKIGKRRMGKMGFLRLRAGDAQREAEKKKPRHAFNDEVWSSVKPYAAPDRVEEYISNFFLNYAGQTPE